MLEELHPVIRQLAAGLEILGVVTLIAGVTVATGTYLIQFRRIGDWVSAYERYRANLGRGILLGLELLVGADIIDTVTAPLTVESVSLLAAVVAIRTFLSFSLETEIEGCWPWERQRRRGDSPRGNLAPADPASALSTEGHSRTAK